MARLSSSSKPNRVLMGRIGAAHGVRGEVRIQSFTHDPLAIAGYGPLETNRPGLTVSIASARAQKNVIVARLEGIADRTAAEKLNGVELYIPRERLPETEEEDDFYLADLIGLEARLADGKIIGRVVAVPNFGAGDLLEIETGPRETALVAFTRANVPAIDIEGGYLTIVPPEEVELRDEGEDGT